METETVKTIEGPFTITDITKTIVRAKDGTVIFDAANYQLEYHEAQRIAEFIVRACNSHYELLEACKKLMAYIDNGTLVRNTANDAEDGWAIKMLPFVQDLKAAQEAIAKATLLTKIEKQ